MFHIYSHVSRRQSRWHPFGCPQCMRRPGVEEPLSGVAFYHVPGAGPWQHPGCELHMEGNLSCAPGIVVRVIVMFHLQGFLVCMWAQLVARGNPYGAGAAPLRGDLASLGSLGHDCNCCFLTWRPRGAPFLDR